MTTDSLKPKRKRDSHRLEPLFLCKIKKETNPFVRYSEKVFIFSTIYVGYIKSFSYLCPKNKQNKLEY